LQVQQQIDQLKCERQELDDTVELLTDMLLGISTAPVPAPTPAQAPAIGGGRKDGDRLGGLPKGRW
jgi:hypothetical protein